MTTKDDAIHFPVQTCGINSRLRVCVCVRVCARACVCVMCKHASRHPTPSYSYIYDVIYLLVQRCGHNDRLCACVCVCARMRMSVRVCVNMQADILTLFCESLCLTHTCQDKHTKCLLLLSVRFSLSPTHTHTHTYIAICSHALPSTT